MNLRRGIQPLALGVTVFALAIASMGCGKNRVTVDVDVTSFIAPEDLTGSYQAPRLLPSVTIDLNPIEINLLEGSDDFINAEELSIDMAIRYDNETGNGDVNFTLFFAGTAADVFNTASVVTVPANLISGQTTNSTASFTADARVLALFTKDRVYMGIRFSYTRAAGSSDDLLGTYTITSLMARVVSTVEIL